MNRDFRPSSTLIRTLFAAAAVLAAVLVAGSIDGLVDHYQAESLLANASTTIVAQR